MLSTVPQTPPEQPTIVIDDMRALDLLRDVVAESGLDHRYTGPYSDEGYCRYLDLSIAPVCLVAHVLVRAGVAPALLVRCEGQSIEAIADGSWLPAVTITAAAAAVLDAAQDVQDECPPRTWGEALAAAEQRAEVLRAELQAALHTAFHSGCEHMPECPAATAPDHDAARPIAAHPEQGWSLLCNGVVVFDDTGELLPDRRTVNPHRPEPAHAGGAR